MTALSSPATLAGLPLTNHYVMAPMTRKRSPGGVPTAANAAYYRRRAEGGVGLIVSEGVLVGHPTAGHETDVPRMTAGPAEDGWRRVTAEVHEAGGRIAAQLWHLGSERGSPDGVAPWTPAVMTARDIDTLIAVYAEAATVAVRAGFDAVEIHAAHGYLLDEFLWPVTNPGRPAARAAVPAEVIRAVRDAIGPAVPLIVRFSQFKERDYAARIAGAPAELGVILGAFTAAGADVLHASQRRYADPAFAGDPRNLAGWAKHLTGRPAITVGSIGLSRDFDLAEVHRRHEAGEFDLVALGRVLLRNPCWVNLAAAGRLNEVHDYDKSDEDVYP